MSRLYILLPVHNRRDITEKFIRCLLDQTYENYHLVLIDDGSTDGTSEMVLENLPNTTVIKGSGDLWWAGALQEGYKWLLVNAKNDDYCLIINDDTIFDNKFLKIGVNLLQTSTASLFLAKCYSQKTKVIIDSGVHVDFRKLSFLQAKEYEEINCLSTRGLFLVIRDFKTVGGFFPSLLPHYLSDYEFTIRAHRKGFILKTDDRLKLYLNEETTGFHTIDSNNLNEYIRKYFSKRNPSNPIHWLIFIWLVCPWSLKIQHTSRILYQSSKDLLSRLA
ncbi:MAG: glycosyltransferase [Methylomonas sp.]|jgi:GT2 family glycosyltransferase|uniref:glycosyltransferase family 2 protein n=1 Tax=Methylomonas sp. TaxID=418 RepID=UPI0025D3EC12|nr:glycosyltransferase [Methylomonas sp.]MCK9607886.1 glycosyltransferase [Methylomonas sp.]